MAVTVDPGGRSVAIGPGGFQHRPARCGRPAEGRVDRPTDAGGWGRTGVPLSAAGVRQRGECDVPGPALPAEGSSQAKQERRSCAVAGCTCRCRRGREQRDHVRATLVSWLRSHAAERLPERVEMWCPKAGVDMPRVVISDQKRRWGSCDRGGTIRLNWRIIPGPHAVGGLRGGPRVGASAAPGPRSGLLAGPRADHAGLRAPAGEPAAAGGGVGVVNPFGGRGNVHSWNIQPVSEFEIDHSQVIWQNDKQQDQGFQLIKHSLDWLIMVFSGKSFRDVFHRKVFRERFQKPYYGY